MAPTFVSERHTVPASGTLRIRYEFHPDQLYFFSPKKSLANGIEISLSGVQGGGSIPILAQGPVIVPGVSENQELLLTNKETVDVELLIIAQRGYPPVSLTSPTTLALAESAYPQAQTRREFYLVNQSTYSYLHNHVGSDVIVVAGGIENTTGVSCIINSVTIDGVAGIPLGDGRIATGAGSAVCGWWMRADVPEGTIQITITYSAATEDAHYSQTFSFNSGIRTGNITTQGYVGATPPLFTVIGQETGSVVLCAVVFYGTGTLTETSGAPDFDPIHTLVTNVIVGMHRRSGEGTHSFDYALSTSGHLAAAALEVLPRL
jgi:hypothetical protein